MQKTFLGLMFSFAISGIVHTYPYMFENEEFFFCFRKEISVRTERIRIVFSCPNVNTKTMETDGIPYKPWPLWCVKSSFSKTSVFVRRNEHGKPTFSKTRLWRPFSKACVFGAWKRRLRGDAHLRFQKYPDAYGQGIGNRF